MKKFRPRLSNVLSISFLITREGEGGFNSAQHQPLVPISNPLPSISAPCFKSLPFRPGRERGRDGLVMSSCAAAELSDAEESSDAEEEGRANAQGEETDPPVARAASEEAIVADAVLRAV